MKNLLLFLLLFFNYFINLSFSSYSSIGSFTLPSNSISSSPVIDNSAIFIGALDSKMYAINISNYDIIWTINTTYPVYNYIFFSILLFFPFYLILYLISLYFQIRTSVTLANEIVYVVSKNLVYALNRYTGSTLWTFSALAQVKYYYSSYFVLSY